MVLIRFVAVAGLLLLAACGAPAPTTAADVSVSTPTAAPPSKTSHALAADLASSSTAPAHLTYKAVGVDADVVPTGLNKDGTIHVPDLAEAAEVDYLDWGPKVGAGRPFVFVSHVNGRSPAGTVIPGGFGRLSHAAVGDTVTVTGKSSAQATYRVAKVQTVLKDRFPSSVYNPAATPTIVLITCGGQLQNHNYLSNVIVTATTV